MLTVREQRRRIERLLNRNPSLKSRLAEVFADAYPSAIDLAANKTGLAETVFVAGPMISFETSTSALIESDQT